MKIKRRLFSHFLPGSSARAALAVAIVIAPVWQTRAATISKADGATNLDLGTSWVGTIAPGSGDIANWSGAFATGGSLSSSITGTAAISWQGVSIGNITGAAAGIVNIGGTASAAATGTQITLGTSGVDMSAANQNLVFNVSTMVLTGATQTWTVAAGRNLRFQNSGASSSNANLDGTAVTVVTVTGGGVVDLNEGGGTGFTDGAGFAGFNGKWVINANTTLRGLRNGATAFGTSTAADTITLSGGTLAVGGISGTQGNWTWNANITLTTATNSNIDQQIFSGTGRYLKLMGIITGAGNLTFKESGTTNSFDNDDLGFIVTGNNSMSGTVTIGGATENGIAGRLTSLRLGGNTGATDVTTTAGLTGDLGTAIVVNNGVLTLSHTNTWTFANSMSGTGSLRIGGGAGISTASTQNVTLTGTNTCTGATTIANGTARIGAGGTTGSLGSGVVTNNGALSFNRSDALSVANTISGTGTLAQDGAGTTTLSGTLSYTGATNVNAGGLNVNTTLTTSAITVGNTATLSGNGTLGTVAVNTGGSVVAGNANVGNISMSTLTFGTGATTARATAGAGGAIINVTANNGLTLNGTTTLNVGGVGLTPGNDYTLVDYVGTIGGSGFAGFAAGTLPPRITGYLVNNTGNTSVDFHVSAFDKPKWTGANDGNWNTSTINWKEITSTTATAYIEGDDVLFDDSAAVGTSSVTLNSTVSPSAVTVSNAAGGLVPVYTLGGTGKISGTAALTKTGNGTLILGNTGGNDYAGATTLTDGTLKLGVTNALPTTGGVSVAASATLDLAGFAGQVGSLTGAGTVTNSGGSAQALAVANGANITFDGVIADGTSTTALVKSGAGTLTLTNASTHTGGTTISAGKLALGSGGTGGSLAGAVVDNATLEINRIDSVTLAGNISGTGLLSQVGYGTTILTGTNSYGATSVTTGTLQIGDGGTAGTLGSGAVSIGPGAILAHNRSDSNTLSNVLSGAGSFRKDGAGTLTVTGNNSFTGGAVITSGILAYGHANALGNSGSLSAGFTLRGGAVDFNGQSNYNPGPTHASGSLPNAVLLINNQMITLGGAAGTSTLQDSIGLGFGSFYSTAAGSTNTSIYYNASGDPGTATISAKFLSTGTSGTFTRAIVVDDSVATATEVDITGQMGTAPDGSGGFGDGKNTTIKKDGAGTLRISAANYFPILRVTAGKLVVNHLLALGQTKTNVLAVRGGAGAANLLTVDGGTVDLNGFSPSIGGLSDGGIPTGIVKNDGATAATLTVGTSNANTTFSGTLQDGTATLALTKAGNGDLTLAGANTHSGGTNIGAGFVRVLNNSGALGTGTVTFTGNSTLAAASGSAALNLANNVAINTGVAGSLDGGYADLTMSGVISGDGSVTKASIGTVFLTGTNTYTGGTTVNAGTLNINADAALGATTGALTINNNAILQVAAALTTNRAITLGTGGGKIDTNAQTVTLDTSSTITGTALEKTGAGILNLKGTETYNSLTTSAGTTNLEVSLGTGTSTITANATTNIHASQTLANLTIGSGAVVTFGDGSPFAATPETFGAPALVPEPGALGLLIVGAIGLANRRRRA
jgi:autotransporter-associated beta strand protein